MCCFLAFKIYPFFAFCNSASRPLSLCWSWRQGSEGGMTPDQCLLDMIYATHTYIDNKELYIFSFLSEIMKSFMKAKVYLLTFMGWWFYILCGERVVTLLLRFFGKNPENKMWHFSNVSFCFFSNIYLTKVYPSQVYLTQNIPCCSQYLSTENFQNLQMLSHITLYCTVTEIARVAVLNCQK